MTKGRKNPLRYEFKNHVQTNVLAQVVVTCTKMQIDKFLCPFTKVKSKWIKNLHIKPDRLIFILEKLGKILKHMGTWENFLNRTPMTYARRSSINIWDEKKIAKTL